MKLYIAIVVCLTSTLLCSNTQPLHNTFTSGARDSDAFIITPEYIHVSRYKKHLRLFQLRWYVIYRGP